MGRVRVRLVVGAMTMVMMTHHAGSRSGVAVRRQASGGALRLAQRHELTGEQRPHVRTELIVQRALLFGEYRVGPLVRRAALPGRGSANRSPVRRIGSALGEALSLQPVDELGDVGLAAAVTLCELRESDRLGSLHQMPQRPELCEREPDRAKRGFRARFDRACGVEEQQRKRAARSFRAIAAIRHVERYGTRSDRVNHLRHVRQMTGAWPLHIAPLASAQPRKFHTNKRRVPMSMAHRSRLVALAYLVMLTAPSCADKNVPASATTQTGAGKDSAAKQDSLAPKVATASASGGQVTVSPAPTIAGAGSAAAKPAPAATGELPKRTHRDSVALASMTTKKDSVNDAKWPVKMPSPLAGAVFPERRVVAFYGNPLSKKMGVLGEYPKDEMLSKLDREVARWAEADPSHPVQPALHLIVTVAQGAPGKAGLFRLQMRDSMVNEIYSWARAKHALLFLDVQVGKSTVQAELPRLRPFLENPDVHLAIDPEFAMATSGAVPGTKIGTLDARDINWAVGFLDEIARAKNLPPKVLIVHRFTRKMVTHAKDIRYTPHVQVVMDMDGWGPPWLKFDSYHDYVKAEPVQFTGFKLFFHNDTKKGDPLLTPAEVLRLNPRPQYIQYQ